MEEREENAEGAPEGLHPFRRSFSFAIKQPHSTTTSLRAVGG